MEYRKAFELLSRAKEQIKTIPDKDLDAFK